MKAGLFYALMVRCMCVVKPLTATEFAALPLDDSNLVGIAWTNENGPGLRIMLAMAGGDNVIDLVFTWVSGLRIDLDLRPVFKPMMQNHTIRQTDDGRWRIVLDFAGPSIQLECEEIAMAMVRDSK